MSWRTVVISKRCKLTYKNNYLVVKNDDVKMIHLSEINSIVMDTTNVSITAMLLNELMERKIKIIFCDEKHNPKGEIIPYYSNFNSSKKINTQMKWGEADKNIVWKYVIKNKINNQAKVLKKYEIENYKMLEGYKLDVEDGDVTNREGHSAKVYFNSLFGLEFTRDKICNINAALDYGYAIILSNFNREIVNMGYLTQLGIHHKNEFNHFNLSCDLMEPFRTVVDNYVYQNMDKSFDREYKYNLINLLNEKIKIDGNEYYVGNGINIYINSIMKSLERGDMSYIVDVSLI